MEGPSPAPPRQSWLPVAALLLAALALRVWQVETTAVPARDCIGFVRLAWEMEHGDWRAVVRAGPQHPGYPAAILGMSFVVRAFHPGPLPDVMQCSAQLVSSVAGV